MISLREDFEDAKFGIGLFSVANFLDDNDIKIIKEHASKQIKLDGILIDTEDSKPSFIRYDENNKNKEYRNSNICWLVPKKNEEINLVFKKIIKKIIEINNNHYQFILTDLESLQFTIYNEGQYYKSHLDLDNNLSAGNIQRKLSFSVQLTDPSEYEGGELLAYTSEKPIVAEKSLGSATFFPSFLLHEVTPVTKGKRTALVGWVHGPKFI